MSNIHKIIRLFIKVAIVVVIILSTTFGWIPTRSIIILPHESQPEISSYLSRIVKYLSNDIGIRGYHHYDQLEVAKNFIAEEFKQLGYEVSYQTYTIKDQSFSNVIANKGTSLDNNPLIIGAHYDSCFNPGADDNASGVAGMLALAKLFSKDSNVGNIVFVAFVNEEPPFFQTNAMGSRIFTKQLKVSNQSIRGAIILEMIGYYSNNWFSQKYLPLLGPFFPNKGNFIAMIGDFNSSNMLKRLSKGFLKSSRFPLRTLSAPASIPGINFSDHWSFWQEQYPAVMVTDTAYLRNKNYHQQTDLPQSLNYPYMAQVILGLKEAVSDYLNDSKS